MAEEEINAFLTHLAVEKHVSPSTQTQALCALVFLYRTVLDRDFGELEGLIRARRRRRLPVVLSRDEVKALLSHLRGVEHLFFSLLYGTGLRLAEGLRLRIKDVDIATRQITVRDGKGGKDRITVLPDTLKPELLEHLKHVRNLHDKDVADGACVSLPYALARKYPRAAFEWSWQYVFPASGLSRDPRTGAVARHHLHERPLQRAFKLAAQRGRIAKPASPHTLRHSFATRRRGRLAGRHP